MDDRDDAEVWRLYSQRMEARRRAEQRDDLCGLEDLGPVATIVAWCLVGACLGVILLAIVLAACLRG